MGKRSRRRASQGRERIAPLVAPTTEYPFGEDGTIELRGSMTPATRVEYARVRGGSPLNAEDAWHRSVEFLFERLVVRWTVAGAEPLTGQKDLLARFRFATQEERAAIRAVLREHLAEWFPDVEAP